MAHSILLAWNRLFRRLAAAIEQTEFKEPICPIYQNVDALPHTAPEEIKANLLKQLTALMCWTQEVKQVIVVFWRVEYRKNPQKRP